MRDIKFRAYNKETKEMAYFLSPYLQEGGYLAWSIPTETTSKNWDDFSFGKKIELMQYTGLKDKNGKEIYEGDIIEHWGERYIVPDFTPLDRSYQAENIKEHHDGSDDWMSMSDVDWEVIGNIYENPELLEDKK